VDGGFEASDCENMTWTQIETSGDSPGRISHHCGNLMGDYFIVYGGMVGLDSNDSIFVLDLNKKQWSCIPS
jgi:hypothetical protein